MTRADLDILVLGVLHQWGVPASPRLVARCLRVEETDARRALEHVASRGYAETIGTGPRTRYVCCGGV